jgi:hypothetical protein
VPLSTLNRRYRRKPPRPEPQPITLKRKEVERLMESDWEPDEESDGSADDWDEQDGPATGSVRPRTPGVRPTGRRGWLRQEE